MSPERRASIHARAEELIAEHNMGRYGPLLASLTAERQNVADHLEALGKTLYDAKTDGADPELLQLLRTQKGIMINYVDVLEERISRLKEVQGGQKF